MSHLFCYFCRCRLLVGSASNGTPQRLIPSVKALPCTFSKSIFDRFNSGTTSIDRPANEGVGKQKESSADTEREDFLGLDGGGVVVELESQPTIVDALRKYEYLLKKPPKRTEEKVFMTNFGSIRYDCDNLPHHLEVDPSNSGISVMNSDSELSNANFIEQQYFKSYSDQVLSSELKTSKNEMPEIRDSVINEQYFGNVADTHSKELISLIKEPKSAESFSHQQHGQLTSSHGNDTYFAKMEQRSNKFRSVNLGLGPAVVDHKQQSATTSEEESVKDTGREASPDNSNTFFVEPTTKAEQKFQDRINADIKNPKTAFDYVMRLRSEKDLKLKKPGEVHHSHNQESPFSYDVDSKGFRIYKNQVNDLENEPEIIVLQILKNSVLYNDNEIVALSKPYGLPVHHGEGHRHSLTKYLPNLAKFITKESSNELFTVHRLDKETTGVILLARTQTMAQFLHSLLAQGKIVKTYWALTKGVPSPAKGIIDIPMAEGAVNEKSRMVLKPDYTDETRMVVKKSSVKFHPAVTKYTVLASYGNAALVELQPHTGVKHQLRVHLASGLNCPVLGDHKYSHHTKLAPQKLPSDMLELLHVRQSKVRHIPMHLHSRAVVIPEIADGKNVHIGAKLPRYFMQNMRRLKIKLK